MSAKAIVSVLGDPKPFQLHAPDSHNILIYCRAASVNDCDSQLLKKIKGDIDLLAGNKSASKGPSASHEITVPHAAALGDVVAQAASLHFSALKIEAVGKDKIRVSAASDASEQDFQQQLKQFEIDLDRMAWQVHSESPVSRVYYVDAANAARALGADVPAAKTDETPKTPADGGASKTADSATPAASSDASANSASNSNTTDSGGKNSGGKPAAGNASSGAGKGKGKGGTGKQKAAAQAGKGAAATAAAKGGSNNADNGAADAKDTSDATTPADTNAKTGEKESAAGDSIGIKVFDPDLLVFSDKNTGDDSAIAERKRILAGIDFPRPEVIINTFSFQTSSSDANVLADGDRILGRSIGAYNDSIQAALYRAWFYLERRMTYPNFFYLPFYNYLTLRFVGEARQSSDVANTASTHRYRK